MECGRFCVMAVLCATLTLLLASSSHTFVLKTSSRRSNKDATSMALHRMAREIGDIGSFNQNHLGECSRGEICGFDVISRETFEPLGRLPACICKPGLECAYTGEFNLATEVYNLRCKSETDTSTRPSPVTSIH